MSRLEEVANVILRVPSIVLLDLLYRWDIEGFTQLNHPTYRTSFFKSEYLWNVYYLAHLLCAVLLMLPLRYLVKIYLYLLTALLLYVAHQTTRDFIRQELDSAFPEFVYKDPAALTGVITVLTGLVIVATLCSLLMRTRHAWLFSSPLLPLLGRLAGLPLHNLPVLNSISISLTLLVVVNFMVSNLGEVLGLIRKGYQEIAQFLEVYRLVALGMSLWTHLAVPMLFFVFWLVLFSLHFFSFLSSKPGALGHQGLVFIFLNSVAECCGTPYCLIGLTFTVSYLALGMLNLCKFYLLGFDAFQNGNVMHRGVTEGITLMLLALQTGLLDLQVLQRTFLLSIILFIVVTSTLQSMIEIADPIVLALGATRNRSPWKHLRGVSMCLFLLVFPCFMAYKISHFFHMDFWLLILVSSCMLTSLQVLGTLFIYALFMIELLQESRVEKMDEIIYCVNAVSRVLEFLVAVCVVAYGTWESIFGEWSWMGVSVIIVHSYFNVWLRAQSGWKSFLLRRAAVRKISSLPRATRRQLRDHNDVCSICFQDMSAAVITQCVHFFHADCLRKWLYIQDTCPMCHQQVKPPASERDQGETETEEESGEEEGEERDEAVSDPQDNGERQGTGEMEREERTGEMEREERTLEVEREERTGGMEREERTGGMVREERTLEMEREERTGGMEREERTGEMEREERTGGMVREERTLEMEREERTGGMEREERTGGMVREERTLEMEREERTLEMEREERTGGMEREEVTGKSERQEQTGESERLERLEDSQRQEWTGECVRRGWMGAGKKDSGLLNKQDKDNAHEEEVGGEEEKI
ncbi:RING finger protein 145-like [Rhinophrynus dorsalis]